MGAVVLSGAGRGSAGRQLGNAAGTLCILRPECAGDRAGILRGGRQLQRDPQQRHDDAELESEQSGDQHVPPLHQQRPVQLCTVQPAVDAFGAQVDLHEPDVQRQRGRGAVLQGAVQQPSVRQPGGAGADLRRPLGGNWRSRRYDLRRGQQPLQPVRLRSRCSHKLPHRTPPNRGRAAHLYPGRQHLLLQHRIQGHAARR